MEPPTGVPYVSGSLAAELLRSPPAAIPESDPLLWGRRVVTHRPRQADSAHPSVASTKNTETEAAAIRAGAIEAAGAHAAAAAALEPRGPSRPGAQHPAANGSGGSAVVSYRQLPSHNAAELTYDDFVRQYMAPNMPVVIRGVTADWRASSEWRSPEGRLHLGQLGRLAGHCRVCVTDTSNQDDGCGTVCTMQLSEYLAWWRDHHAARRQEQEQQEQQQQQVLGQQQGEGQSCPGPDLDWDPVVVSPEDPSSAQAACSAAAGSEPGCSAACDSDNAGNDGGRCDGGSDGSGGGSMYLKDWHFVAEFPEYGAYRLPTFFADDWLNAYYDLLAQRRAAGQQHRGPERGQGDHHHHHNHALEQEKQTANGGTTPGSADHESGGASRTSSSGHGDGNSGGGGGEGADGVAAGDGGGGGGGDDGGSSPAAFTSDYRFFYLGPAGTWTPLHSDVLRSHSWSANVCGRKRWLMIHPRHTHLLYDRHGVRMAPHFELERVCSGCRAEDFPGLEEARRHVYEFIQETGDAVFVPSGWHHCVENLADTLSINHNWLNGHNCHWTWALLRRQYVDAAAAIEDCRPLCASDEFEQLVQATLAANMGLDWSGWVDLLACVVERVLAGRRRPGPDKPDQAAQTTASGGAEVEGGRSAPGVEALLEDAELMNGLLTVQRAGLVLRDVLAASEELVLAPARKTEERKARAAVGGEVAGSEDSMKKLLSASYRTRSEVLLARIDEMLRDNGFGCC